MTILKNILIARLFSASIYFQENHVMSERRVEKEQNNHSGHYGWDSLCFSLYIFFGPVDFGVGPVKQWKIGDLLARQGLVGPVDKMS